MANEIKDKFGSSTALTITLASLAASNVGVGRQSTLIDNTTNRYSKLHIFVKVRQDGSLTPTANRAVYVYLLKADDNATEHITDGGGTTDAALTIKNAQLIGALYNGTSPAAGDILYGEFIVYDPGRQWGVAIVNSTGRSLHSTGSNHWVRYVGANPEVQ